MELQKTVFFEKALFNLIRKGQEMIVQVTKDPINQKGAMLTTFVSLPGRLSVLMPGTDTKGVSRKITDETERKRLRDNISVDWRLANQEVVESAYERFLPSLSFFSTG